MLIIALIFFFGAVNSLIVYPIVYTLVRLADRKGDSDIKILFIIDAVLCAIIFFSLSSWTDGNASNIWAFSGALCITYSYFGCQISERLKKEKAIQLSQQREKERRENEKARQAQRHEEATFVKLRSRFPNLDIEKLKEKYPLPNIVFLHEERKTNDFTFSVSRVLYDALKDASEITGRSVIVELRVKNYRDTNSSLSARGFYIIDEHLCQYSYNYSLSDSVSKGQKALEIGSNIRPAMEGSRFLVFDVNPSVEAVFLTTKESMFGKDILFSLAV